MAERKEVRLAGAGTHGMIQAGLILQEAAAIYDDLNAHHVQSYTGQSWVSENPIHRKVGRALGQSPSSLRIGLALHIGFPRMSSAMD